MSTQKFPLAAVNKVRRYIQDALILVNTEEQSQAWAGSKNTDELPEPESLDDLSGVFAFGGLSAEELANSGVDGHWFISTVNPAAALPKLTGLQLKPEFRLVSYLYRGEQNKGNQDGIGLVFAMPQGLSTTAQLEKALVDSGSIAQPPKPKGALNHFMEAIEGDRSPASFMIASILRRELQEFGALGSRCSWSHHRLIDVVPAKVRWQWQTNLPQDLSPKVKVMPDGRAAIEFFTCRIQEPIALYRHLDQYPLGQYKSNGLDKAIAVLQR